MARDATDYLGFGVAYLGVADLFSKGNSSPQTTELNAKHRAPTLMKWVNIESVESAVLIAILTLGARPGHRQWPLLGGLLSLVITYSQYLYAKAAGLASGELPTETFPPGGTGSSPRGRQRRQGSFST